MSDLTLDDLVAALPHLKPAFEVAPGVTFLRQPRPSSVFVPPPLAIIDSGLIASGLGHVSELGGADIVVVKAAAAAGKSMFADHLAGVIGAPLLDFAYPPKLAPGPSLLTGQAGRLRIKGVTDPVEAFRAGTLPLVVDALDEGLGRSVIGYESFLGTVWDEYGPSVGHPKAVFIGREQAVDLLLAEIPASLSVLVIALCLFDRGGAEQVLVGHSRKSAEEWDKGKPMTPEAVTSFFNASAQAFGSEPEHVFDEHSESHAFVGYAPVLATVGGAFGRAHNPSKLAGQLTTATGAAWQIIDGVLDALLEREQEKFRSALPPRIAAVVPTGTDGQWSPAHQLTVLASILNGRDVERDLLVNTVPAAAASDCRRAARISLDDHPFLIDRTKPRTQLFSARILAAAAIDGEGASTGALRDAARFPFLWRFLKSQLKVDDPPRPALDSEFCAAVLASMWQDDSESALGVWVDGESVSIGGPEPVADFVLDGDLELWGNCSRIEANVERIVLAGEQFVFATPANALRCDALQLPERRLQVAQGEAIVRAGSITGPGPDFEIDIEPDGTLRVGGELLRSYIFVGCLPDVHFTTTKDEPVYEMLDELRNYHSKGEVLHLDKHGNPSEAGPRAGGLKQELIEPVAGLVKVLVAVGLVELSTSDDQYWRVAPRGWQWYEGLERYVEFREGRTVPEAWSNAFLELGADAGTAPAR